MSNTNIDQESNFQVYVRVKPFSLTNGGQKDSDHQQPYYNNSPDDSTLGSNSNKYGTIPSPRSNMAHPPSTRNCGRKAYDIVKHDEQTIQLIDNDFRYIEKRERFYQFNSILGQKSTNKEVFNAAILPKLDGALDGINTTIMAYGITGAGKTHTIFGESGRGFQEKGVCNYTIEHLLAKMNEASSSKKIDLYFSYLEIYNEQVIDLLNESSKALQILDDSQKGS